MPRTPLKPPLALLLLSVQILSPLPGYLGAATSMALGTTIAAATILLARWVYATMSGEMPLFRTLDFLLRPAIAVLLVFAIVLAHSIVASEIQAMDLERSAASFVPLTFVLLGGITLGTEVMARSDEKVDQAATISFWVLFACIALRFARLEPRSDYWEKPMFPYTELSHFALAFGPMLMYRCVRAKPSQTLWWLLFGFAVALSLQSMALLVCCFLIAAACRRMLLITGVGAAVLLGGLPLELAYFSDRLDFSGSVQNVTNLVYVQGWQEVQEAMAWSSGWGVGFQQMGFRESQVAAAQIIRFMSSGIDLNLTDGSFVFAKLASEFGIAGIVLGLFYVVAAARCLRALRRGGSGAGITLARCVVVAYGVDMFARGAGYFVESTLLFVAAVTALLVQRVPAAVRPALGDPVLAKLSPSL